MMHCAFRIQQHVCYPRAQQNSEADLRPSVVSDCAFSNASEAGDAFACHNEGWRGSSLVVLVAAAGTMEILALFRISEAALKTAYR